MHLSDAIDSGDHFCSVAAPNFTQEVLYILWYFWNDCSFFFIETAQNLANTVDELGSTFFVSCNQHSRVVQWKPCISIYNFIHMYVCIYIYIY